MGRRQWRQSLKPGERVLAPSSTVAIGKFEGIISKKKKTRFLIRWDDASPEEWCSQDEVDPLSDCDVSESSESEANDDEFHVEDHHEYDEGEDEDDDDQADDEEDDGQADDEGDDLSASYNPNLERVFKMRDMETKSIAFGMSVRTGRSYPKWPTTFKDMFETNEEFIDYSRDVVDGLKYQSKANKRTAVSYCNYYDIRASL